MYFVKTLLQPHVMAQFRITKPALLCILSVAGVLGSFDIPFAQSALDMFDERPAPKTKQKPDASSPLDDVVKTWLTNDLSKKKETLRSWRKKETSYCGQPPNLLRAPFTLTASFNCDKAKEKRGYSCWMQNDHFKERIAFWRKRDARKRGAKNKAIKRAWQQRCKNFDPKTAAPNKRIAAEIAQINADLERELAHQNAVVKEAAARLNSKHVAQGDAQIAADMIKDQKHREALAEKQRKKDALDKRIQARVDANKAQHIKVCTERYQTTGKVGCNCYDVFPQAKPTSIFEETGSRVCEN